MTLASSHDATNKYEIGVDECARGPMFGRLYVSAVVLPKTDVFRHDWMKDSKKIKSKKRMGELSAYIKQNAIAWHIHYIEASVIDEINIRQAVLRGMRECISQILTKIGSDDTLIVVDGNDFTPFMVVNSDCELREVPHITCEKADGTYSFVAAASILAKHAHDTYILELCQEYPLLATRYGLHTNMGYGTASHMAGIRGFGITQWHRKSFGICANATLNSL